MLDQTRTVLVTEGQLIPFDGKVIDGLAFVDESAVMGVSTPVLLENQAGRDQVVAGGVVVEGWLKIQCHSPKPAANPTVPVRTDYAASLSVPEVALPVSNSRVVTFLVLWLCVTLSGMLFALIGHVTGHSEAISLVAGIVGLIIGGYEGWCLLKHIKQSKEDAAVLRHTISVNLSILVAETEELSLVVARAQASPETTKASRLLTSASTCAQTTPDLLSSASKKELGKILEQVFQAMLQSTEARRLLKACSAAVGTAGGA
jgi:hypothetical protein